MPMFATIHFETRSGKSGYPRPTSSDIITTKPTMAPQEANFPLPLK